MKCACKNIYKQGMNIYTLQIGFWILQMLSLLLRETKVSFNFIQNPKTNFVTIYCEFHL